MIWYSFLEKRGGVIKKIIKWQLYNDKKLIIDNETECEINNNVINYQEEKALNTIDLNNKIYIRDNKEYKIVIDFKNSTFKCLLKKPNFESNEIKIKAELIEKDKEITLKYKIDIEEIKIIIYL